MKRVLSLILSICMCIACMAVPACVFAANEPAVTTEYVLDMSGIKSAYLDSAKTGSVMTTVKEKTQTEGDNGETVETLTDKTVCGVFVNKKITTPAYTDVNEVGEEITVPESVQYEKAIETSPSDFKFTVENGDIISDIKEDGSFDIKKSGLTKLTAEYIKDGAAVASASCFIVVAEDGGVAAGQTGLFEGINNAASVDDPYYNEDITRTVLANSGYNNGKQWGSALGTNWGSTGFAIPKTKTFVISEWDYDAGKGNEFKSALCRDFTGGNTAVYGQALYIYAGADSEYYGTRTFLENTNKNQGVVSVSETTVKRSTGWHQTTAIIEPGTVKDDENSVKITLYLDGEYLVSYEKNLECDGVVTSIKTIQELAQGRYACGAFFARCEVSSPEVKEVYPKNGAENVPVRSGFGVAFKGTVGEGYSDKITVTKKAEGSEIEDNVEFNAKLSANGNKINLDMGKLDANTTYKVELKSVPVNYVDVKFDEEGKRTAETAAGAVSGTYSFKTKANENDYLDNTLNLMDSRNYSLDYMRYADFSENAENLNGTDKLLTDEHIKIEYPRDNATKMEKKNGITTKINNGILSVDFTKEAANIAAAEKTNVIASTGASLWFTDLDSIEKAKTSSDVVARYKYKIRGAAADADNIEKNFRGLGRLYHIRFANEKSADFILPYVFESKTETFGNISLKTDNAVDIVKKEDVAKEEWVEITHIIEYNDGENGTANRKIKSYTVNGPSGTYIYEGDEIDSYNLRAIKHTFFANTANITSAVGFDFKDFEVYGFERPVLSELSLKVLDSNNAEVNTDKISGKTVKVSFDAKPGTDKTADVIIMAKETESNLLVGCKVKKGEVFEGGTLKNITEEFEMPEKDGTDYTFSVYIWNSLDGLVPLETVTSYNNPTLE